MKKRLIFLFILFAAALSAEQFADVRVQTLANGLTVAVKEVHEAPLASIQLTYRVGMRDAPEGRAEMPHFVEHMMFKGTPRFPRDKFALAITENGGSLNGYTSWDRTSYVETVPAQQVRQILEMEASRMTEVAFAEADVATEKKVVLSEIRNYAGAQTNAFNRDLAGKLCPKAATLYDFDSRLRGIGEIGAAEAKAFYEKYYRSDNATLVVVGDVNAAEVLSWAEDSFGKIARPAGPLPKNTVQFLPITEKAEIRGQGVVKAPFGFRYFNFVPFAPKSRDYVILFFINATGIIPELGWESYPEAGYIVQNFNKRAPAPLEVLDWSSLEVRFESEKAEMLKKRALGQDDISAISATITESIFSKGDAAYEDWLTAQFGTVRFPEVRAFIEKYFAKGPTIVAEFTVTNSNDRSVNVDAKNLSDNFSTIQDLSFLDDQSGNGEAHYRDLASSAYDTLKPRFRALFDGVRKVTLENGLTVHIRQSPLSQKAWATLLVPAGTLRESLPFTAKHTAEMVFEGGPQVRLTRELQGKGVTFNWVGVSNDYAIKSASGPGTELEGILRNFTLALGNRQFNSGVLAAQIEKNINGHRFPAKDLNYWINENVRYLMKKAGYTSYNPDDSADALRARLSVAEAESFYAANYRPSGSVLIVTSPEDPESVEATVRATLGSWSKPDGAVSPGREPGSLKKTPGEIRKFAAVEKTRENVVFMIQSLASGEYPSDREAQIDIGTTILGDQFTGRLFRNLRVRDGLTYGTGAWYQRDGKESMLFGGYLLASPANLEKAIASWKGEVRSMGTEGPTPIEYAFARNKLLNSLAFRFRSTEAIHGYLVNAAVIGKPMDYVLDEFDAIWKADRGDFQKIWKEDVDPDRLLIAIAGPGPAGAK